MRNDPIKVLLVEDHSIAQKVELEVLKQLNCAVDAANNGVNALEFLSKNKYDIVFMDLGLPDIDGLTLTETIRRSGGKNASIPIVALTVYSDNEYKNRAIWVGMNDFIAKPLTTENCEKALRTYVTSNVADKHSPDDTKP